MGNMGQVSLKEILHSLLASGLMPVIEANYYAYSILQPSLGG
jgi:hypothetical protein